MSVSPTPRISLGVVARRSCLTAHLVAGVGLLGTVAAVLAVNVRAAATADPALAAASYDVAALWLATGLAVFKPRRRRRRTDARRLDRR
jgi:hypothetical protein